MKRRVVAGTIAALALSVATLCHVHAPELVAAAPASGSAVTPDDSAQVLAATPPMGWNSWDGYGLTINEEQYRANVSWMAEHLKKYGWQYAVIDQDWFVANPTADGKKEAKQFQIDAYGRFIPAANRFPSVTPEAGFKPLADWVHSRGMKFGVHILRGIPRIAVEKNLPIADSNFHARDAADTAENCSWAVDNYGMNTSSPAAAAYYDSIAKLYASWGVDFLKVDCISSHPYRGDDIKLISDAIRKTGYPMVLSLSPGPAPVDKADELKKYAQMWRISDDEWDLWHNDKDFPKGVGDQFKNLAKWAGVAGPGHWPDADMLAIGRLGPHPGEGEPRATRLTHDEQRTLVTLWSIARSPLIVGGDLTAADAWTESLLTNADVVAVDQQTRLNRPVVQTEDTVSWIAYEDTRGGVETYVAVFNLRNATRRVKLSWNVLGLNSGEPWPARDLWSGKDLRSADGVDVELPPHGCALYRLHTSADVD
jgi:alpha-galactosidase